MKEFNRPLLFPADTPLLCAERHPALLWVGVVLSFFDFLHETERDYTRGADCLLGSPGNSMHACN